MKSKDFNSFAGLTGITKIFRIARYALAVTVIACFCNITVQAAYLKNVPQTLTQPDGTILRCLATGDEYHHWLHDANNFTIVQDPTTGYYVYASKSGSKLVPTSLVAGKSNPSLAGIQPGLNLDTDEVQTLARDMFRIPALKGGSGVNTTGTVNNIVIFIRFSDQSEFPEPMSSYSQAFNATGTSSMTEYFKEVSGAQLTINTSFFPSNGGSTVVSYQDSKSRSYYSKYNATTNTAGYQNEIERSEREMTLLKDATESVKSQIESTGLNYDSDGNGQIDNVCYIVQGSTDGWADLLWPHMWALYAYNVTIGGAQVWNFNFQLSQTFGVSVLCHEMSHSLGFPDLYRYTNNTINPVSSWDVMASTTNPPQHPSVYLKEKYGNWTAGTPEISTNGTYTLKPVCSDPFAAYRISSPNSSSEYFMVEYRKTEGRFDSQLLGSGLIIYRVNPSITGNSFGPPDEVYVFRPNGTATVNGSLSQAYFSANSGRTTFGSTSNPSCLLSDGSAGGFQITNIGSAGETISFTVSFGNAPVSSLSVAPLSREIAFTGGSTTFAVSNSGSGTMGWTASVTTGGTWAHITSGASGSNTGSIAVTADSNPGGAARTAVITVTAADAAGSPKTITIVQAANGAILNISPDSRNLAFGGGECAFIVTNAGGGTMNWAASVTAGSTWAHITSGNSGTNSGSIQLTADANTGNSSRTAIITVTAAAAGGSPKTLTVVQEANGAVLSVAPESRTISFNGSNETFSVSNTGGGNMNWSAAVTAGSTWAHITSGNSGSNAGSIAVTVDANTGSTPRSATITVTATDAAGSPKTINISQEANGAILNVTPASRTISYSGGNETFSVSNTGGGNMNWSAAVTDGSTWAHITSGNSGSNAGSIAVTVDANTGSSRTAVVTLTAADAAGSPKTLSIFQEANSAVLNVTPESHSLSLNGGDETFSVTNTGGGNMNWTAEVSTGNGWAHIISGNRGTNSGSIQVSFDANNERTSRSAQITVTASDAAGSPKTIHVSQSGNESVLFAGPENQSAAFGGATVDFEVANTGRGTLNWSAEVTTGSSWAQVVSGSAGTNAGTIRVTLNANNDNTQREATITVSNTAFANDKQILRIIQEAGKPVMRVDHTLQNLQINGGRVTFSVANIGGGSMKWSAAVTVGESWAKIISGTKGINAGIITVEADANLGIQRTAEITITADDVPNTQVTVLVVQEAKEAELAIDPDLQTVDYAGANLNFGVSTIGEGTINWRAEVTDGPTWAHITSGQQGSNDGEISVQVDENPGGRRTATITVVSTDPAASTKILTIIQEVSNGINNPALENNLKVYPNPVVNQCTVQIEEFNGTPNKLEVYNMMGQLESSQTLNQERSSVDLSNLPQGVYLFRVTSESNILSQRRVIKN